MLSLSVVITFCARRIGFETIRAKTSSFARLLLFLRIFISLAF